MMNSVTLIGRLVTKVYERTTGSGQKTASFKIAVNRNGADAGSDFFWIKTWNGVAGACAGSLEVGDEVGVQGALRSNYDKDEDKEYVEVNAQRVDFLRRGKISAAKLGDAPREETSVEASTPAPAAAEFTAPPNDDDIPF